MKTITMLGAVLIALMISASAFAAPPQDLTNSPNAAGDTARFLPTLIFNRKLASTSVSLGEDVQDYGPGKVAVDSPLTFVCPKGGCTVTAEMHVQMGFNTTTGNRLALCVDLDGSEMPPIGCPNVLDLPTNGDFMVGSFAFAQSGVTAGTHTLQGFVDTTDGATRANYIITYRLYTP